jgi:YHS domain-containing protein
MISPKSKNRIIMWAVFIAAGLAIGGVVSARLLSKGGTGGLRKVASREVCMVTDRHFGKEQTPVPVGGRVYYGCCAGCKGRLTEDPASRTGRDPVTGRAVDKAVAVIGARPDGSVVYFENDASLASYRPAAGDPSRATSSRP